MIVCPRCGKENQDHYKFCLGCGAELPRDAAHAPKSFTAPTPPAGFQGGGGGGGAPGGGAPGGGFGGAPRPGAGPGGGAGAAPQPQGFPQAAPAPMAGPAMAAPAPAAPAFAPPGAGGFAPPAAGGFAPPAAPAGATAASGGDSVVCPKCSSPNNKNFKFCGTCGFPLAGAAAPAAAPAPAPAPAASGGTRRGSLVLIRPDGSEGDSFPMTDVTAVGREAGGLFASDSYLSPRHATFTFGPGGVTVQDENSLNGVYLRIAADTPTELRDGAIFRIGQEIVRFERLKSSPGQGGVEFLGSPSTGLVGRICLIIGRETYGNCYAVPAAGLHLGRERGDLLFPDDGYVSGLHCRLHEEGGRMLLTDVGSSNGTFVRLTGSAQIPSGSLLLMGQQLFRCEY